MRGLQQRSSSASKVSAKQMMWCEESEESQLPWTYHLQHLPRLQNMRSKEVPNVDKGMGVLASETVHRVSPGEVRCVKGGRFNLSFCCQISECDASNWSRVFVTTFNKECWRPGTSDSTSWFHTATAFGSIRKFYELYVSTRNTMFDSPSR